ncbi:unnamed protein product [Heterobilharzia americana]|nr:unnamed protein product [Heterobilharzia americana]
MPLTESSIQLTKQVQNDCMNSTRYFSCFSPYKQNQINCILNPLNPLRPTTCNIFSSIERLTHEENSVTSNNSNVNLINTNSTKKIVEECELSTKLPYLFPVGWVSYCYNTKLLGTISD